MRLGTCIALEIVTGLVTIGGASFGGLWAYQQYGPRAGAAPAAELRAAVAVRPAPAPAPAPPAPDVSINATVTAPEPAPAPAPAPAAVPPPPASAPAEWTFVGHGPDAPLLDPVRTGKLVGVKFNRGGSSLSLRLEFDNGARAAFKPEQTFLQSNPRREIAAYRIDRLLGIGHVPPAIGRSFTLAELEAAVVPSQRGQVPRLRKEAVARRGVVKGEASWWIPIISDTYIGKDRIDSTDAIVTWRKWLKAGATVPEDRRDLCAQLSTMTVFDFVIDNIDRWTGNNAKTTEDGTRIYFMDNTMSFSRKKSGTHKNQLYLERVQTFSRRLITRLRTLEESELRTVLEADADAGPFDRLLSDQEIAALFARRDHVLEYVDGLIAKHGEDKILVFP